jgi:hypothetical protein
MRAYDTPSCFARPNPLPEGKYKKAHVSPPSARHLILILVLFHINFLTTIPSKMVSGQRSVSSSSNPKKLMRPQRTEQSKSTIKPASGDVYDTTLDSDGSRAIDGDDSFRSYIAREAEEILDAAGDKGCAKDAESQVRSYVYLVFDALLTT